MGIIIAVVAVLDIHIYLRYEEFVINRNSCSQYQLCQQSETKDFQENS